MNSVSIHNAGNDALALIQELKKMGLLKTSKPKKKRTSTAIPNDAKQESDLVSYAIDNIPSFRAITPDMSQSQIEDIQRRQAVDFATLRAEVEQQRLEDINFQQGQRFDDIQRMGTIFNKFRSQNPEQPFDPLANLNPSILSGGIPDINENTFSSTINEGAPDIVNPLATGVFVEGGEERPPRMAPREPVGKKRVFFSKRAETIDKLGLPPVPKQKGSSRAELEEYYKALSNETDRPINENIKSKEGLFNEIYRIIDEEGDDL
jgi:hypothetical protein